MIESDYDRSESPSSPALSMRIKHPYNASERTVRALVDTGASVCCISAELAHELALPIAQSSVVELSGGERIECATYFADIDVGMGTTRLRVVALGDERILGRDLLNRHTLVLDGPNSRLRLG